MTDDAGRRHHVSSGNRVREVEQAAHERPVALDDLGEQGLAASGGRWTLDDEAALRTDGHDHGVLDRLCLHQPEDLRPEVLAPVGPPDAAAGDLAAAQVHRLDARRVDPHLDERARLRQIGDQLGVELEREVRLGPPVRVRLEVVRSQHRADDTQIAAKNAVLVETLDGVDRLLDLLRERTRPRLRVLAPGRIEAQAEELDESPGDLRVGDERVLHVVLAEGAARLAQVLRDRTQQRDLAGGELRDQDEAVEAVVLRLAAPRACEHVLEAFADLVGLELGSRLVLQAEVVDPHGLAVPASNLERTLVGHLDAHVLEDRHHVLRRQG